jgi:hypothetical protein
MVVVFLWTQEAQQALGRVLGTGTSPYITWSLVTFNSNHKQWSNTLLRTNGHPRRSRGDVCLPAYRRRSEGWESWVEVRVLSIRNHSLPFEICLQLTRTISFYFSQERTPQRTSRIWSTAKHCHATEHTESKRIRWLVILSHHLLLHTSTTIVLLYFARIMLSQFLVASMSLHACTGLFHYQCEGCWWPYGSLHDILERYLCISQFWTAGYSQCE